MPNYFYMMTTATTNLRNHLRNQHPEEYDRAVVEYKWNYKLTTQSDDASAHKDARKLRNQGIPSFSPRTFLDHLVRFIVADDQVGLNDHVFFHILLHLFSQFVSLSALNFDNYVWSFANPSSTLTSLAAIK